MKCDKCNEREATVFFEQTVNGSTTAYHLCNECAAELKHTTLWEHMSLPFGETLFGNLFGTTSPAKGKSCPACGAGFADIRREGKVCCPECYQTFSAELESVVRSLHGKATHTGRAPVALRAQRDKQNRMSTLRRALQEAITQERYEDAARLRDEIKALEKEEN